ncbi:outer membrane protein assembly factor BamA [Thiohalophilus sp.]|uniref:outer membrane protein assembly factor BamA n=1 Tax=Thiohalophilus sp. TaxID=3028392 RepID=UPI002ACE52BA|nr:outer membrane protein assembly factor BamA [Thiohalophilus sp.]MDZ7805146.1 outer membrane protein assembly factor BamA [Thiohalophilus sp.]
MALPAKAFDPFVIEDIRLEGLQRISAGTIFNYLPLKTGDRLDPELSSRAIRDLYETGFFKDVKLEREGDVLVVFVAERPAIADIRIEGNDSIPDEQLESSLQQIGLVRGQVLDRSTLDKVTQELERQYYGQGKYGVEIETVTTPLERNRVDIEINIAEGVAAEIFSVNIVGNKAFNDEELLKNISLSDSSMFGREKYSRQVFSGDLEALRSYYLDRGYINFNTDSSQVSLTPDKQEVYITINITEGEQYTVRDIKVTGDTIIPLEEVRELITLKVDEIYSHKKSVETTNNISDKLAARGYAFANVNLIPELDKDSRSVALTLSVDPGRRVYVRRINITGNTKTRDEVIRRELRQHEGDWLSTEKVSLSRTRLDRLGFFEQVSVETPAVSGTSDQVDVNFNVKERPTGSLTAGIGYSDTQGALINFGLTQENFLGTGKRLGLNLNNSDVTKFYNLSYTNPYYTDDGVSRGFNVFWREVDAEEAQLTRFTTNTKGASVNYGFPLSEITRANFSLGYENTEIIPGANVAQEILDFIDENGSVYDNYEVSLSWRRDSRNRAILADSGSVTSVNLTSAIPGSNLEYYKIDTRFLKYFGLTENITLSTELNLGYGDSFGDTGFDGLPPYMRYYAGGSRTVRGYDSNSLGPNDCDDNRPGCTNDPLGGSKRVIGSLELILPNIFAEQSNSTRIAAFFDAGNVFAADQSVDVNELRTSAGLAFMWLAPIGTLRFSYAMPLNDEPGDDTQNFQFTMGSDF